MDGYWKRSTETEAALAGAWLRTGDIGRRGPGGFLFLVDRKKDMLITGGFNVYPAEVEAVLAAHPAIVQSCVIGAPDPKWGERVVAIIHCRPGMEIDASEVIDFVKARKGSVMAPKTVICTDRLPVTALGKLDRKEARRLWGHSPS
jgi:fatty-acyl-CoA synthase